MCKNSLNLIKIGIKQIYLINLINAEIQFIIQYLIICSKFNYTNLNHLIDALIECSKKEIVDSQVTFCL
jgi:hypothetical protein